MSNRNRRARLTRSAEFERVYRQGRSQSNRHLIIYTFPNPSATQGRVGFSVSRKVGSAVERNRVKRLLREAFDRRSPTIDCGQDVVVVARPDVRDLAEHSGLAGVDASLWELLERAGLGRNEEASANEQGAS